MSELMDPLETASEAKPYSRQWYAELEHRLGAAACRQLDFYAIPEDFLLSVVIPVFNEEATLRDIVAQVKASPIRKEIILVDDCSRDRSREIMREIIAESDDPDNRVVMHYHEKNRGKGAALRTGFAQATGDVVLVQDADLEYDPSEYPRLLHPIIDNKADVVFGSRFLGDRPHRVLYYRHYMANQVLTMLSNLFTNLNLTDMETCYKVFTREAMRNILPRLKQDRFGFEPEVTAKVARQRFRIYELSVSYSGRTYEQGKKIGWKDGVQALWCILRYGITD